MFYKKVQSEEGDYKNTNNVRFTVLEAHEAFTPQGKNVGWDEFADLETAVAAYGLTYDPLEQLK
jgi:hypothetical protein